ncbi:MAG TPA: hypothetical protein VNO30_50370 [Kofleriaceae bacterium]|nr:hypothetical protein [Kofleriaceae bacterium]
MRSLGRRVVHGIAAAPPWAVLAAGWAFLIVYAFPGVMTLDSFDHLDEARRGVYTDAHPPAINLLWRVVDYVIAGPFGMLVIQSGCFLVGLYAVLRRALGPRGAAWATTLVYVVPPVMGPFAVIWKDPLMAGFLMLGAAALLSARRGVRIAGLAAMAAATALRYNAFAATLPLVVLLFEWRPGLPRLRRYAISTAAWLAVTLGAQRFNAAIVDHELHLWTVLAVFDIAGTLARTDGELTDAELEARFAGTDLLVHKDIHATIRELYKADNLLPIINHATKALWGLPINGTVGPPAAQREAIARVWRDTITTWPGAYLAHRLAVMREAIGLGKTRASGAIPNRDFLSPERVHQDGLGTGWSKLQHTLTRLNRQCLRSTPLYSVWMYLVIALALLPLALRHPDLRALLLSGLGLEASLLVLAASADYRYSHWLVICTIVIAVALGARRYRGRGQPAPSPEPGERDERFLPRRAPSDYKRP